MNLTAIAIVALVCWAIVELVNGPKGKKKEQKNTEQVNTINDLEREVAALRDRIETLEKGERHRLVGLSDWGKIAEIWQHTDPNNPSNEDANLVVSSKLYSNTENSSSPETNYPQIVDLLRKALFETIDMEDVYKFTALIDLSNLNLCSRLS